MSAAETARTQKVSCLLLVLDAMRIRTAANDDQMLDFVSGMSDQQWADLTVAANDICPCSSTHGVATEPTRTQVLDILHRRLRVAINVQDALAQQLQSRSEFARALEVVR